MERQNEFARAIDPKTDADWERINEILPRAVERVPEEMGEKTSLQAMPEALERAAFIAEAEAKIAAQRADYDGCTTPDDLDTTAGVRFIEGAHPQAALVGGTSNMPLVLATVTRGYTGVYQPSINYEDIKAGVSAQMLNDVERTKLQTPLEFIHTVWLLRDVTRAFANQLVRYRVGTAFVQESFRFSTHEKMPVLIPNALVVGNTTRLLEYKRGVREAVRQYHKVIDEGGAVQDARGLLPLNTLTSLFFACSMRTLAHIYEQRTCCQAQSEEWVPIMRQMRESLRQHGMARYLKSPWESGQVSCGFGASFDRPCSSQFFFDRNLAILVRKKEDEKLAQVQKIEEERSTEIPQ